jgi:hypothetical protein
VQHLAVHKSVDITSQFKKEILINNLLQKRQVVALHTCNIDVFFKMQILWRSIEELRMDFGLKAET